MECGKCILCCELLPVKWLNKPVNTMCKHCDKGCKIHTTKPEECTSFSCMYAQVANVPEKLRPDNCKVIFEKLSDDTIHGTVDARFEVTDSAKKQAEAFIQQGYTVVLGASDFRKPMIWQPTEQI